MIINVLGEIILKLIEGNEKTSFNTWKILRESYTKSDNLTKNGKIKNRIKELK